MALENKDIFSRNLIKIMNQRGVTRNDLCDDLGFKYMTVSDWINAKTYPRIDKIELLANYFGISKSDLIEDNKIEIVKSSNKSSLIYKDADFQLFSTSRNLTDGAGTFLRKSLLSMTEEKPPTREYMITWLRDNWHYAAEDGFIYEDMNDEELYEFYIDAKQTLEEE